MRSAPRMDSTDRAVPGRRTRQTFEGLYNQQGRWQPPTPERDATIAMRPMRFGNYDWGISQLAGVAPIGFRAPQCPVRKTHPRNPSSIRRKGSPERRRPPNAGRRAIRFRLLAGQALLHEQRDPLAERVLRRANPALASLLIAF
jgi:hypothetical protein